MLDLSDTFTMRYPVALQRDDDGTVMVTFPDFSGTTSGRDRGEALQRAAAFLIDAMRIYRAKGWPIPRPAVRDGDHVLVPVPLPDDPFG
ncbi:MAG TPA: type II toxin-antitoxin system HicB family antitoxin [Luteitalea sp.]|nr:type II toxin-antitoxin system HicB family antitoxin [Luteitalea sp.]